MMAPPLEKWCVIFDFDGIVMDTEPIHYRAFQRVLEPLKLAFSWDEYVKDFIGYDDRDAFEAAFRRTGKELDVTTKDTLIRKKAVEFRKLAMGADHLFYDGIRELIRECRDAGFVVGMCSGALAKDIQCALGRSDLRKEFKEIVSADDVKASKPDPESYQLVSARLGTGKGWAVAIEDTPAGIASARSAGLAVVAVANSHPAGALQEANLVIDSLLELNATILKEIARQGLSR